MRLSGGGGGFSVRGGTVDSTRKASPDAEKDRSALANRAAVCLVDIGASGMADGLCSGGRSQVRCGEVGRGEVR